MNFNAKSALIALAALGLSAHTADAQTYGFATLPPGTLNHTTASAVAKVMKEKAGMNMLVQPTAGDQVIIPMVSRGEVEIGITNILELADAITKAATTRICAMIGRRACVALPLLGAQGLRRCRTIGDLKGKRVALRLIRRCATIEPIVSRAILATGDLTEKDIQPVMVPNVMRSADDFMSGAADMFFFAFGGPKVREVDATRRRHPRARDRRRPTWPAARKITPYGYLTEVLPGSDLHRRKQADEGLRFRQSAVHTRQDPGRVRSTSSSRRWKSNKDDLVAVQPVLREFAAAYLYKKYDMPYHPAAIKYFKDKGIEPQAVDQNATLRTRQAARGALP